MGKADWECYTGCDCIYWDASRDDLRIYCYWKCNGWRYNMSPVYGYTYFQGGNEACVFDGGINFQDNQSTNLLGYHDYTVWRGHSTISSSYQSRIISESSYESGDKWSGQGWYDTGGVTHTVITYNANGGSGQPGNQDKWYGEALWLSNTRPTRTGYTFRCWNTASNGTGTTYNPGQQYAPDPGGTVTLYAIWDVNKWQVSYNGNSDNVTNVPSAQTKTYGQTLTLSSQVPQKVDYNFLGWNTKANGSGTTYQPGASFTTNAATVLYAQWELAYVKPRINNLAIARCDSAGNITETGTNLRIDFDWITDLTGTYAKIQYKKQTDSTWTTSNIFGPNDNKSGTVTKKVIGSNNIDTEYSYVARIYIYDSKGASDGNYITYSGEFSIGTVKYPIDVKAEGSGVAFGKVAEEENIADFEFQGYFRNNLKWLVKGQANLDANDCTESGHYYFTTGGKNLPIGGTYARMIVSGEGGLNATTQILTYIGSGNTYIRTLNGIATNPVWSQWRILNPSAMTVSLSNRPIINLPSAWTNVRIPLDTLSCSIGDGFEFSDGGIKVKRNMKVSVTGQITHFGPPVASGEWDCSIEADNGGALARAHGHTYHNLDHHSLPTRMVQLQANDIIRLKFGSGDAGDWRILGDHTSTYLTVQEL